MRLVEPAERAGDGLRDLLDVGLERHRALQPLNLYCRSLMRRGDVPLQILWTRCCACGLDDAAEVLEELARVRESMRTLGLDVGVHLRVERLGTRSQDLVRAADATDRALSGEDVDELRSEVEEPVFDRALDQGPCDHEVSEARAVSEARVWEARTVSEARVRAVSELRGGVAERVESGGLVVVADHEGGEAYRLHEHFGPCVRRIEGSFCEEIDERAGGLGSDRRLGERAHASNRVDD